MKTSLRDRFVLFLSLTGITIIAVIGLLTYRIARDSVLDRTFAQLKTVRNARKFQLEQYFRDRVSEAAQLGRSQELHNVIENLDRKQQPMSPGDTLPDADSYIFSAVFDRPSNHELVLATDSGGGYVITRGSDGRMKAEAYSSDQHNGFSDAAATCIREQTPQIHDYIQRDSLPLLYVFAPVFRNGKADGALGLGISADALNSILLEQNDENGLGYSGEVYVIGSDFFMRSQSRFIPSSVMQTRVSTQPSGQVFQEGEGSMIARDYRDIPVLSSFSRMNTSGLNWAILAEIDEKEALEPLNRLRNAILLISVGIIFLLVFLSFWLSRFFTRPLLKLKTAVSQLGTGKLGVQVEYSGSDELGELAAAFNNMSERLREQREEIATRERQLENERRQRILSFIDGEEKERQRLSRELHDGIGQIFVATRFHLESLLQNNELSLHPSLSASHKLVNQGIAEIRKMSNGLAPAVLSELGLASALRSLCHQMEESSGISIEADIHDPEKPLRDMESTHLYRIAQESLSNAVKHSKAETIKLSLESEKGKLMLIISDNGCGFSNDDARMQHGQGLANIRERARLINACLKIDSEKECGTRISLTYHTKCDE